MNDEEKPSVATPLKQLSWAAIGVGAAILIWVALQHQRRGALPLEPPDAVDAKTVAVPESSGTGNNPQRSTDKTPAVPSLPAVVAGEDDVPTGNIGPEGVLRVGGDVTKPELIKDSRPVYSEAAKAQRIRGPVIISTIIDRDGRVCRARFLENSASGLTAEAALEGIRKRRYRPATQHGKPVAVEMIVTVNIDPQQDGPGVSLGAGRFAAIRKGHAPTVLANDLLSQHLSGEWNFQSAGGAGRGRTVKRLAAIRPGPASHRPRSLLGRRIHAAPRAGIE
jgi:TonB family protein